MKRAGWKIGDVQRFEINEAFAAVVLALRIQEPILLSEFRLVAVCRCREPLRAQPHRQRPHRALDQRVPPAWRLTYDMPPPTHCRCLPGAALKADVSMPSPATNVSTDTIV